MNCYIIREVFYKDNLSIGEFDIYEAKETDINACSRFDCNFLGRHRCER